MTTIQIRLFAEGSPVGPDFQGGVPGLASEAIAAVHAHNGRILLSGGDREDLVSASFPDYDLKGEIDIRLRRIEIHGNRKALESLMPALEPLTVVDTVRIRLMDGEADGEAKAFVRVRAEKETLGEHLRRLRRAERKAAEREAAGETVLKKPMPMADRLETKARRKRRRGPGPQPIYLKIRSRSTGQHFSLWIGKRQADGQPGTIGSYGLQAG